MILPYLRCDKLHSNPRKSPTSTKDIDEKKFTASPHHLIGGQTPGALKC
jgi:hypothetical protein